ncbi:MAG TPA: helix-turn-helix domain-containing protein [Thermomicrobiales bacterium]|nr:helix-turn-helix domain-containing protein [Thermomicrobiales bacterium]
MVQRPIVQRQRIGPAIRRLRRMNGLTLDDLASQAGISASHLSRLERGQTLPSFQVLSDIAHVLGADVDEFVRLETEVTERDAEFREILDARGVPDDIQQELMSSSIELRRALIEIFKELPSPKKRGKAGSRNGRGETEVSQPAGMGA